MEKRLRWGVLSTANIGMKKVLPAMQQEEHTLIAAIASRDLGRAEAAARQLGIENAYGSYEQLLEDDSIDAVYIPVPNHLHVPLTEKALEHGKHVLCEKPFALTTQSLDRTAQLQREKQLLFGEAYMVVHHPRWKRVRELLEEGVIGRLEHVQGFFSFYNPDPENIRNIPEYGGGSVYDIGVYPVVTTRFATGSEPVEVFSYGDIDPKLGIDRISSVMMQFPGFSASFTCSMQVFPSQHMSFYGSEGVLTIDRPFNTPYDSETRISIRDADSPDRFRVLETCAPANHYTLQAESFYRSVVHGEPFTADIEFSRRQKAAVDAIYRSQRTGAREQVLSRG